MRGTNLNNMKDRDSKKRQVKGEMCSLSKLKEKDIHEISTISIIINNKIWQHI